MTRRERISQALAACNGGPGLTLDELAAATGFDRPTLRSALASMTHDDHTVTCERGPGPDGAPGAAPAPSARYRLGDPTPLILI